ncbi:ATP-grasp domain-containing protein [Pseudoroseomonas ludipueritiae]|uniref:ATP-grasp domain-containing protein n=1 Tax=Pseudoroseomonas ludipueritiae TaxID=198093 RepID=A0ABR7RD43_9PROT|nr:ATP-grasp domain-containing protein [Pseudoroseomonas ludipueritiae]MBC9179769.1 ATP-grasp domain-containing protein [Pseudoroseomonas ludipueritiae]
MPEKTGHVPGDVRKCLILASGSRLQYRALRCAADHFSAAYVLGTIEAKPLSSSHACRDFLEAPVGKENFQDLSPDFINRICAERQIGYILPSDSATTRYLTTVRNRLHARCYPVPPTEVFDILDNKFLFSKLCGELELPYPRSHFAEDGAVLMALAAHGRIRSPSVAKPLSMAGSFGVTKLVWDSPADLRGRVDYSPILVQDYIDGTDISAFFLCQGGRDLAWVIYRRDKEKTEFLDMPPILDACRKINRHLEYDGVLGFDIRISPDGSFYFLECNPRFWYNMHIAQMAGLNFVALGFESGEPDGAALNIRDVSVTNLRAVLRKAATHWVLDRLDRKVLRYFSSDLVSNLWMLQQRLSKAGRMADGHSL